MKHASAPTDYKMKLKLINQFSGPNLTYTNDVIADFLHEHLGKFRDNKEDILKAIEYVFTEGKGGHVLLGLEKDRIIGAVVLNNTGMSGYIPENILVYIAVDKDQRGKGVGMELMHQATRLVKGDIALHVEPDNPAVSLYQRIGFTNKYLEMRFVKNKQQHDQ